MGCLLQAQGRRAEAEKFFKRALRGGELDGFDGFDGFDGWVDGGKWLVFLVSPPCKKCKVEPQEGYDLLLGGMIFAGSLFWLSPHPFLQKEFPLEAPLREMLRDPKRVLSRVFGSSSAGNKMHHDAQRTKLAPSRRVSDLT